MNEADWGWHLNIVIGYFEKKVTELLNIHHSVLLEYVLQKYQ